MKKIDSFLSVIGGVLLLVGAVVKMTQWAGAPYIYMIGAILYAYVQVKYGYEGKNIIIRRLRRQQLIGAALLVIAGVMMCVWHHNEWIACMTVAAVLQTYTAFRIPQEERKEQR